MASTSGRKRTEHGGTRARRIGKIIGTVVLILVLTLIILACFAAVYVNTVILPEAKLDLSDYTTELSSTIYYKDPDTGEDVELRTLYGVENREWVSYDELPQTLVNATIAVEDKRFYKHNGVDWIRTANAIKLMFTGKDIQGGSTITQQLIKNMTSYDDVTVKRKVLEIFRALDFDKKHDKATIMEMYLNYIYLGDNCYGVATAAKHYFDKELSELTLAECASLISITNNPTVYSPYRNDGEMNKKRQEDVLNKMCEQGMITESERDAAKAETLAFSQGDSDVTPESIYSWYEEQLISDVVDDLMDAYGYSERVAQDLVTRGGLQIYSCIDLDIQSIVDEVYSNQSNLNVVSKSGQQLQSAIVIIDTSGNVVGLAGAMGDKTGNLVWNNASDAKRQPGSALKPLSVYAPALELDVISPTAVFDDTPVRVLSGSAWPVNSYGTYTGRMTLASAVARSSNPIAVRVLEMLSPEVSFEFLENKFGISTLESGRTVSGDYKTDKQSSPLALGGLTDGVTVMDMAAAYSTFPRGGVYIEPRTYTKVLDAQGEVLLDNTQRESRTVIQETTAWYMNDLLKGVVNSSQGTGTTANFSGMTIAGKTGSTNSNNDRWFVGYTPYYTAAVWTGYQTPERIYYSGANPACDMWKLVMEKVHKGLANKDFNEPSGLKTVTYCADSGLNPTQACTHDLRGSRVVTARVFAGDVPTDYCEMHVDVSVCTSSPILNANGEATGLYHLVGDYCPAYYIRKSEDGEETLPGTTQTIALLNYSRDIVGGIYGNDYSYFLSHLQAYGTCTVHTGTVQTQPQEDPDDSQTQPTQSTSPGTTGETDTAQEETTSPVAQHASQPPTVGQETDTAQASAEAPG